MNFDILLKIWMALHIVIFIFGILFYMFDIKIPIEKFFNRKETPIGRLSFLIVGITTILFSIVFFPTIMFFWPQYE